ncbi:NUDIX hydrolase [Oxalobacteraceae bacterium OM1]|nr:NUDIX hydrolase [Oxalobacteraceae bacterium OM1]
MRSTIRSEVLALEPCDELEAAHIADVCGWIDSGVELCRLQKPATPPKHLVSYFVVVDGDHVLLVDHKNAQLWLPTGGHVEPGEHPWDTVIREAKEELQMDATPLFDRPLFLTVTSTVGLTVGHIDVSLWYVLKGDRRLPIHFDEQEFNAATWFHVSGVPLERSDPHMSRFLQKLVSKFRGSRTSSAGLQR